MTSPIPSSHIGTRDYSGPQNFARYSGRTNENPVQFSISVCDETGRPLKHLKFDPATDAYSGAINVFTSRSDATPSYTNDLQKLLNRMKYIANNSELFAEIAGFARGNGIQIYYNYSRSSAEHANLGSKGGTGIFFWPTRTIRQVHFTIPAGWYYKKDLYQALSMLRPDPNTYQISSGAMSTVKSRLAAINMTRFTTRADFANFLQNKILKGSLAGINFTEAEDEETPPPAPEEPKEEAPAEEPNKEPVDEDEKSSKYNAAETFLKGVVEKFKKENIDPKDWKKLDEKFFEEMESYVKEYGSGTNVKDFAREVDSKWMELFNKNDPLTKEKMFMALGDSSRQALLNFNSVKLGENQDSEQEGTEKEDASDGGEEEEKKEEEEPEENSEGEEKEEKSEDDEDEDKEEKPKKEKVDESDELAFYNEEEEEPDVKDLPEVKESGLVECVKSLGEFSKMVLEGKLYDIPETHGKLTLDLALETLTKAKTLANIAYQIAGEDADQLENL